MADRVTDDRVVVRQPIGNVISLGIVVAGAAVGVTSLAIAIGVPFGWPFALLLVGGLAWFGARATRVRAEIDGTGVAIHNLFATDLVPWSSISALTVERRPGGGGWGLVVSRGEEEPIAIEAAWGPWYASRGRLARRNKERCERLAASIADLAGRGEEPG